MLNTKQKASHSYNTEKKKVDTYISENKDDPSKTEKQEEEEEKGGDRAVKKMR
jgi:hypothetical protein